MNGFSEFIPLYPIISCDQLICDIPISYGKNNHCLIDQFVLEYESDIMPMISSTLIFNDTIIDMIFYINREDTQISKTLYKLGIMRNKQINVEHIRNYDKIKEFKLIVQLKDTVMLNNIKLYCQLSKNSIERMGPLIHYIPMFQYIILNLSTNTINKFQINDQINGFHGLIGYILVYCDSEIDYLQIQQDQSQIYHDGISVESMDLLQIYKHDKLDFINYNNKNMHMRYININANSINVLELIVKIKNNQKKIERIVVMAVISNPVIYDNGTIFRKYGDVIPRITDLTANM